MTAPSGPYEPAPRPNDRSWQRSVKNRLDQIRGEQKRPPLRERLHTSPGFANLSMANQRRMRELLLAGNPHNFNHAKYDTGATRSIQDMMLDIRLAAGASRGKSDDDDDTDPFQEYLKSEAQAAAAAAAAPPATMT